MNELSTRFKVATVWLLLGTLMFLGVQAWRDRQQQTRFVVDGEQIEIQRGSDGHYHWPGRINDRPVDFLIDTGATRTAISADLARGLSLPTLGAAVESSTANGMVSGRMVRADLVLEGGIRVDRLRIVALPNLGGRPLLGMDVLGRLRWSQDAGVLRIDLRPMPAP